MRPLHNPLPISLGAEVSYADRMPKSDLRTAYPELADCAPVDIVDDGYPLLSFKSRSQNFIIYQLLCRALQGTELRGGGFIYVTTLHMDRFDISRERTSVALIASDHINGTEASRERPFPRMDYFR